MEAVTSSQLCGLLQGSVLTPSLFPEHYRQRDRCNCDDLLRIIFAIRTLIVRIYLHTIRLQKNTLFLISDKGNK